MHGQQLSDAEMRDLRQKIARFSEQLSPAQRAYLASTLAPASSEEDVEGHLWNPVLVAATLENANGPSGGSQKGEARASEAGSKK